MHDRIYRELIKCLAGHYYQRNLTNFFSKGDKVGYFEFVIDAFGNTLEGDIIGLPEDISSKILANIGPRSLKWIPAIKDGKTTVFTHKIPFEAGTLPYSRDTKAGDFGYYCFALQKGLPYSGFRNQYYSRYVKREP